MPSATLSLLTSCFLLAAQVPIDETTSESTIKVKKKSPPPKQDSEPKTAVPPPPPTRAVAPLPRAEPPVALVPTPALKTAREKPVRVLPWVALGGSLAATAVGIFFAVRTTKAIDDQANLEFEVNLNKQRVNIPQEFRDSQKAVFINSITATVLISSGIAGSVASAIVLGD